MKTLYFTLLMILLLGLACDEPEPIPAYLSIPTFEIVINDSRFGSASNEITEVWVTVDGAFLGVYDLPATVPVLKMGSNIAVKIEAGIHDNGLSRVPDIYPFYAPWETTVDLLPEQTLTLSPVATYLTEANVALIEDFEDGRPRIFTENILNSIMMERTDEGVFEGQYSGRLEVPIDSSFVELLSAQNIHTDSLQSGGFPVYLEVNYKSDVPVVWGILGFEAATPLPTRIFDPGFLPSDEWRKIYFNLTAMVNDSKVLFNEFQLGFQALIQPGDTVADPAVVLLDNIKLVHFSR